jgi:hypothetical protein
MPEGYGNLTPAPGYSYTDEIGHIEILYSTVGLTQKGVTLTKDIGTLLAGTCLGRVTATKRFQAYNISNTPAGINVARGFLRDTVDTTGREYLGNIVIAGMLRNSKLIFASAAAAAITDLNARVDTALDLLQF